MSELYEKATPRPWAAVGISVEAYLPEYKRSIATIYPDMRLTSAASSTRMISDAALIVHAVNNIERLEAQIVSLREALRRAGRILMTVEDAVPTAKEANAIILSTLSSTGEG